jgi:hypothetical protein
MAIHITPKSVRIHPKAMRLIEDQIGGPVDQSDLARRWHTSQASVSRWLGGVVRMPYEQAEDLARSTRIPLEMLIHPPGSGKTDLLDHWRPLYGA